MVKGKIRRRQAGSQFQPRNKFSPSYRVAPGEETARPHHNVHSGDDYHGSELQPRPSLQKTDECEPLGNRVVNLDKMITIMNDVYRQHSASDKWTRYDQENPKTSRTPGHSLQITRADSRNFLL